MSHEEITYYAHVLQIPYFRGVFSIDRLPKKPNQNESAVVNLDLHSGPGTHYVAYKKRGRSIEYYDSYGDMPPPRELSRYFGPDTAVHYNVIRKQAYGTSECGRLVLRFLYEQRTYNLKAQYKI